MTFDNKSVKFNSLCAVCGVTSPRQTHDCNRYGQTLLLCTLCSLLTLLSLLCQHPRKALFPACIQSRTVFQDFLMARCRPSLYSVQCTMYSVNCTVYIVHCTVYTVHSPCTTYIVYTANCILYSVQL